MTTRPLAPDARPRQTYRCWAPGEGMTVADATTIEAPAPEEAALRFAQMGDGDFLNGFELIVAVHPYGSDERQLFSVWGEVVPCDKEHSR